MLRSVATLVAVLAATAPGLALSRYDSDTLECPTLQAILDSEGAAIVRYPSRRTPGMTLYDRFVGRNGHCDYGQRPAPFSVPTAGGESCQIMRCAPDPFDP